MAVEKFLRYNAVNPDEYGITENDNSSIDVVAGKLAIKDSGVSTAKIADNAVTLAKLAADALAYVDTAESDAKSYADGIVTTEANARIAEDLTMLKLNGSRQMTGSLGFAPSGGADTKQITDVEVTSGAMDEMVGLELKYIDPNTSLLVTKYVMNIGLDLQESVTNLVATINAITIPGGTYDPNFVATYVSGTTFTITADLAFTVHQVPGEGTSNRSNSQEFIEGSVAIHKISGVAAGTAANDVVIKSQLDTEAAARIAADLTMLKLDGSRPMTGALNVDGNEIQNFTGLRAELGQDAFITGSDGNSEITFSEAGEVGVAGQKLKVNTVNGLDMSSKKITALANGTAAADAVNKGQLDSVETSLQNSINAISSSLDWREAAKALTDDADLAAAANGDTLASVLPFSDDEGTQMVAGDFAAGDFIVSRNGASSKIFTVYDDAGTLKITNAGVTALSEGHAIMVKYDLADTPAQQETNAIFVYNGITLVKVADMDWALADGIDLTGDYASIDGGVVGTGDSVQAAIAKLAGANSIATVRYIDGSLTTAKLADNAVTHAKLADNAVETRNIKDGHVLTAKLADNAVTQAKLADNAVEARNIKDGEVLTDKLADNAVTTAKINAAAVTTEKMADDSVTAAKIAADVAGSALGQNVNGSLEVNVDGVSIEIDSDALRIKDSGISTAKIADNAITNAKMADDSVGTAEIIDLSITLGKLAANSVDTSKIVDASIILSKMAANSVGTAQIVDASVTEAKLDSALVAKINATPDVTVDAVAGEALVAGDIVFMDSSDDKAYKAQSDAAANCSGKLYVVKTGGAAEAVVTLAVDGVQSLAGMQTAESFDTTKALYLSSSEAGKLTHVAPTSSGNVVFLLGYASDTANEWSFSQRRIVAL